MSSPTVTLVDVHPDDRAFADWCDVWAASALADRPEDPPRPAADHDALLLPPDEALGPVPAGALSSWSTAVPASPRGQPYG